ncbi:MAG: DUF3159 domain-containing protein [Propionibacteriales bacterium]|nr:DUF3159 domain-containing protein [Propionibacteriales bacterium]
MSSPVAAGSPVTAETVEQLVRHQMAVALGGRRGLLEGIVPTLAFTVTWISTHNLRLALALGGGATLVLLVVRLVQRSSVQYVLNAFFGIAIAAFFALRSGNAEDAFLPGIWYNAGYFVLLAGSTLARWPVIGFMIGSVTGDPTGWHRNPQIVRLCSLLTWILAIPCAVRVAVYYPLWEAGQAGALGIAKITLGWPLQVAALATMAWVLSRNHTPIEPEPAAD